MTDAELIDGFFQELRDMFKLPINIEKINRVEALARRGAETMPKKLDELDEPFALGVYPNGGFEMVYKYNSKGRAIWKAAFRSTFEYTHGISLTALGTPEKNR